MGLILSGAPYLRNVQTVPDTIAETVRVVVEVAAGTQPEEFKLRSEVVANKNREAAGLSVSETVQLAAGELTTLDFVIPIKNGHLWTPEDPFLYELRFDTGADAARERFGLRSYRFDPVTKRARSSTGTRISSVAATSPSIAFSRTPNGAICHGTPIGFASFNARSRR